MRRDTRTLEERIAERTAKIDALQQTLTEAVESLVTSEDWIRALTFAARFRSRSFSNTLLIWVQHSIAHAEGRVPDPMPTRVAGFQQWRQLGRHVMKGQSGYQILAPVTARVASLQPDNPDSWRRLASGEKPARGEVVRSRMVGVKPAYVWDVSQTDGKPIPELPAPRLLTGQAPAGLWDGLAQIIAEHGFTLHDTPDAASIGGANGVTHWINRTVHVRLDLDDAARCRTLAHEVGHIVLHADDHQAAAEHRDIAEVEAESVALMIAAAHGMDATQYTIPYVSAWAASRPGQDPVQTVQSTAGRVRAAALGILDRLDTLQIADSTPSSPDHRIASTASAPVSTAADQPDTDSDRIAVDNSAWCRKEPNLLEATILRNPGRCRRGYAACTRTSGLTDTNLEQRELKRPNRAAPHIQWGALMPPPSGQ